LNSRGGGDGADSLPTAGRGECRLGRWTGGEGLEAKATLEGEAEGGMIE